MPHIQEPKIISGNANRSLAKSVARRLSMHRGVNVGLVDARVERFNDGEIFVEVYENVRGEDMFILQSTSNPANDNLLELLIMSDALRRSSAQRITAVIPYFGYARQDRRTFVICPNRGAEGRRGCIGGSGGGSHARLLGRRKGRGRRCRDQVVPGIDGF